jgi:hypothetical protein
MATIALGNCNDSVLPPTPSHRASAVLDAHIGNIHGAWGTIRQHDTAPRKTWLARLLTLLVIAGPRLDTMVAGNDADGVGMPTLRAYLVVAALLMVVKVVQLVLGH